MLPPTMFPGAVELGILAFNTVLGAVLTLIKNGQDNRMRQQEMALRFAKTQKDAREYEGPQRETGFHLTRRIIAIAVCGVWTVMKLAPIWYDGPVAVAYMELTKWGSSEVVNWAVVEGLVWGPMDNVLFLSIIGMFFGNQMVKR